MSFLSDLFEGNFGNLGTDITHAPSSFVRDLPSEAPYLAGAAALGGGLLFAPEIAAGLGLGGAAADAGGVAADIGAGAADLSAADDAFGTFDPALFAANTADVAAGGGLGADVASLAAPIDIGAGGGGVSAFADPTAADVGAFSTDTATNAPDAATAVDTTATPPATSSQSDLTTVPAGTGTVNATTTAAGGVQPLGSVAQPATTGGAVAGGGTGGITGTLGNIMSSPWTKLALGATPLAMTLAMGEQQLPSSAQSLQNQALQMQQTGLQNLQQAQAGILNQGQTAQLAVSRQNQMNAWLQTLANQGVTDPTKDTRWPQIQAMIDQNITAQTSQMIQQNITNALAETGQASSALTSIAQMQMNADNQFTNNLINATKSLGLAAGVGAVNLKLAS